MSNPNIGPRWKKGQSGNPAGRPKKYVTTLKEIGYKLSEINDTLQTMIAMDYNALKEIEKDRQGTMLEQIVAKALLQSWKKGSLYNLETLLTRVYGAPKQAEPEPTPPPDAAMPLSKDPIEASNEYQELMG